MGLKWRLNTKNGGQRILILSRSGWSLVAGVGRRIWVQMELRILKQLLLVARCWVVGGTLRKAKTRGKHCKNATVFTFVFTFSTFTCFGHRRSWAGVGRRLGHIWAGVGRRMWVLLGFFLAGVGRRISFTFSVCGQFVALNLRPKVGLRYADSWSNLLGSELRMKAW